MSGMAGMVDVSVGEDRDLVGAVRQGDDRAFEVLYGRYHARIAAYVRGMVKDHARAEDVTQEVFFSALRRMRETERPIAFKPWVYEIARNACIDAYRRTSRAEELSYDAEDSLGATDHLRLVSATPGPDDAVESKQRLDDLCGAFGGLSEAHHQILVLRELEGLSYREIGERLGMSRPAVESTLFRARRRLTEEYDELVSGRRCERVQAVITAAAEGMLGARDRRKLARHTATCQACRRHARRLGVEEVTPQTARAKLAALLPIPAFLRRGTEGAGVAGGHGSSMAAQMTSTLGAMADPIAAGWGKALATVATLAFAGAGAGVAAQQGSPLPDLSRSSAGESKTVAAPQPARSAAGQAVRVAVRSLRTATADANSRVLRSLSTTRKAGTTSRQGASSTQTSSTRAGSSGGSSSAAASSPQAPPAASAPNTNVTVPDVQPSSGSGGTADTSPPSDPSGPSVGELTNLRASTPPPPSEPPGDIGSAVDGVGGGG